MRSELLDDAETLILLMGRITGQPSHDEKDIERALELARTELDLMQRALSLGLDIQVTSDATSRSTIETLHLSSQCLIRDWKEHCGSEADGSRPIDRDQ